MDVGMKLDRVNVWEVTSEYSERGIELRLPELGCPVIGAWNEIVAKGRELHIPDWEAVAMIYSCQVSVL
jgi:aryl carrier-like protein